MLTTWRTVSTLDRMLDDVMGSTLGTATNSRTFQAAVDVRANVSTIRIPKLARSKPRRIQIGGGNGSDRQMREGK